MKKTITCILSCFALGLASPVIAKSSEPQIAQDNAKLPSDLTFNIANIAISNGVKEPLNINKDSQHAKISGTNSTTCMIKLSNENQILGVKCN